jgi:hypothetical protein
MNAEIELAIIINKLYAQHCDNSGKQVSNKPAYAIVRDGRMVKPCLSLCAGVCGGSVVVCVVVLCLWYAVTDVLNVSVCDVYCMRGERCEWGVV